MAGGLLKLNQVLVLMTLMKAIEVNVQKLTTLNGVKAFIVESWV